MRTLALYGASGHGKVVAEAALAGEWDDVQFFDDRWPGERQVGRWEISGNFETLMMELGRFQGFIVSIGDCRARWERQRQLCSAGATAATIIHPTAWISPSAHLGAGTVVMAGCVVQADVTVGEACIINTCSSIDHDSRIGHAVHVAPGVHLSGNVVVGDRSWIGVGASIRQGIRLGCDVMVGAGAVVVGNYGDDLTIIGCPARPRRASTDGS